ncbi:2Fe-2S iron-sulfur cluster binding domain-containing protein [Novosphingobium sp. FSY-8]|uniref:2Fe-2S iron-sulfur cluster binding domain-containing protein n=1 Tax=Novosphingobium ovatum TaxID=1908523 RepID=A0ABW9XCC2_9SPHN|nr:(2Fe-2S)-binding protein [Novosphingobium ovatum]NBC36194.1 2Fe-2S iron-sulfur cluster binding domain-containing protein [Novosphingobium ovatum]
MAEIKLTVNGAQRVVDSDADTPLLWALRDDLGLVGTKFGCGAGLCGACTVHVEGQAVRSCQFPVSDAAGKAVTTIEGLAPSADQPHAVQAAWVAQQVPQCGYCQPGMIMAVAALLKETPHPTEQAIREGITNICRCGTYPRVVAAVQQAAKALAG